MEAPGLDLSPIHVSSGKDSHGQSEGTNAFRGIEYEERAVAFIDILGFKEAVRKSVADEELLRRIHWALNIPLDGYAKEFAPLVGLKVNSFDERFHSFSDCIVLSVKDDIRAIGLLVFSVFKICQEFLKQGFTARGGIAKGKLYHWVDDPAPPKAPPMVFWPAFIDAYMLESMHADSPRVIMQNAVRQYIQEYKGGSCTKAPLLREFFGAHMSRAEDGPTCVNVFANFGKNRFYRHDDDLASDDELKNIQKHISQALDEAADVPRHFMKLAQLARDFNAALRKSGRHAYAIPPERLPRKPVTLVAEG